MAFIDSCAFFNARRSMTKLKHIFAMHDFLRIFYAFYVWQMIAHVFINPSQKKLKAKSHVTKRHVTKTPLWSWSKSAEHNSHYLHQFSPIRCQHPSKYYEKKHSDKCLITSLLLFFSWHVKTPNSCNYMLNWWKCKWSLLRREHTKWLQHPLVSPWSRPVKRQQ